MSLPFTVEQFFEVFRAYNAAVWPAQVALHVLAIAAFALVFVCRAWAARAISLILAVLWWWSGLAYHLAFFARINSLAYAFAALFAAAAILFAWHGTFRGRIGFRWAAGFRTIGGLGLVAYSLVAYPAWLLLAGHTYPAFPTFGAPCPLTIFTLGLLGFASPPYPRVTLLPPILWCLVGMQGAFQLGVAADAGLIVAGLFGIGLAATSRPPRGFR